MDRWQNHLDSESSILQSRPIARVTGSRFVTVAVVATAVSFAAFQKLSLPAQEATYLLCSSLSLQ